MGIILNSLTSYFLQVFLRLFSKVTRVCFHLPELTCTCCSFDYPGMFCFDTRDESSKLTHTVQQGQICFEKYE